jgi:hypothetical protein
MREHHYSLRYCWRNHGLRLSPPCKVGCVAAETRKMLAGTETARRSPANGLDRARKCKFVAPRQSAGSERGGALRDEIVRLEAFFLCLKQFGHAAELSQLHLSLGLQVRLVHVCGARATPCFSMPSLAAMCQGSLWLFRVH